MSAAPTDHDIAMFCRKDDTYSAYVSIDFDSDADSIRKPILKIANEHGIYLRRTSAGNFVIPQDGTYYVWVDGSVPEWATTGAAAGAAARDAAVKQVAEHTNPMWRTMALQAAYIVARTQREFTSDDVWLMLGERWPNIDTHEHRAMGPIMSEAMNRGWSDITNRYVPSVRASKHRGPSRVWKSKLTQRTLHEAVSIAHAIFQEAV
jgi:hypothetical protein